MAKVLVVGGGGREMCQAMALAASDQVSAVFCAPGNGGTATYSPKMSNVNIKDSAIEELVSFAQEQSITLVAIGPEAPLVAGIADALAAVGIPCFGPTQAASRLEASKAFSKDFFARHNLPSARFQNFTDFEAAKAYVETIDHRVVVKASGLAGGKGVLIPADKEETLLALQQVMVDKIFGSAGDECVVEEMLEGPECSVLAFCDGTTAVCMPAAQDHKRALDGDEGLNTGGMGAYAPCPCLTPELQVVTADIVQRTVTALAEEGTPYVGVLFAGFMLTATGPQLLEYNVRMGDPETEVVLPLLQSDLFSIMHACTTGKLAELDVQWSSDFAATVVMAAKGYPESYGKGARITGLGEAGAMDGITVYHAGTKLVDEQLVTSGGRVLAVTAVGSTCQDAVSKAYGAVAAIRFEGEGGAHFRTDIAKQAL